MLIERRFADSYLPDTANISSETMPWSLKTVFCPGAGAATTVRLPESPREASFLVTVELTANRCESACKSDLPFDVCSTALSVIRKHFGGAAQRPVVIILKANPVTNCVQGHQPPAEKF